MKVVLGVAAAILFAAITFTWGISVGLDDYRTRMTDENYVIVNDGCLELWNQKEGKHYEIGRLCPDSTAPQVVYRFEIFPQYITLIEE